jgi:nickel/cobalt exporter
MTIPESEAHPHDEHGPHRGTCVKTEQGIIEISVFETGVPPRFRLYFFDANERATNPPRETVMIETIRRDGRRQRFDFRLEQGFLESTGDIPEPHEFEVKLEVSHEGHIHTYRTRFAEEGHVHGGNGHSHDEHGHDHDHGSGFFGWLKGLYGHSHSVVDKVDSAMESNERGIWALKVSLVGLGITAALNWSSCSCPVPGFACRHHSQFRRCGNEHSALDCFCIGTARSQSALYLRLWQG